METDCRLQFFCRIVKIPDRSRPSIHQNPATDRNSRRCKFQECQYMIIPGNNRHHKWI